MALIGAKRLGEFLRKVQPEQANIGSLTEEDFEELFSKLNNDRLINKYFRKVEEKSPNRNRRGGSL